MMPSMSSPSPSASENRDERRRAGMPPMLYQNEYLWFVFVSAMDLMLTWIVLTFEGREVNPIAAYFITRWSLAGLIAFKFTVMVFVILVCEYVGRRRSRVTGRRLIWIAVIISALPILWSFILLYGAKLGGSLAHAFAALPHHASVLI